MLVKKRSYIVGCNKKNWQTSLYVVHFSGSNSICPTYSECHWTKLSFSFSSNSLSLSLSFFFFLSISLSLSLWNSYQLILIISWWEIWLTFEFLCWWWIVPLLKFYFVNLDQYNFACFITSQIWPHCLIEMNCCWQFFTLLTNT